jgi:hypothetical protein
VIIVFDFLTTQLVMVKVEDDLESLLGLPHFVKDMGGCMHICEGWVFVY